MKKFVESLIAFFFRVALWFRYRIRVEGLDKLNKTTLPKPGGVLFLPSHPTYYVDPIINTLAVFPKYRIRPMVVEYMYFAPFIYPIMKFLDALPIPNFNTSSNSLKRKKSEKVILEVIKGLKEGTNFMVYPAGNVKHTAYEAIGGASGAHRIVQDAPEANVVLVRIKGLWGSKFSKAIISKPQTLGEAVWDALKTIFKNLIFFTPRREVIVELLPAPEDFPWKANRLEFNRYLEEWYNRPDGLSDVTEGHPGDSLVLVSYSMWKDEFLKPKQQEVADAPFDLAKIPPNITQKVIQRIAEITERPAKDIQPQMHLAKDLGMDSLDAAEVVAFLSDEFEVEGLRVTEIDTVGKVLEYAAKEIDVVQEADEEEVVSSIWKKTPPEGSAKIPEGETIPDVFIKICKEMGKHACCVDARSGTLTYKDMLIRSIILAEKIRQMPGEYIGIMLPASVGADVVIFSTLLAGKVPLMVNWTLGSRHMESVIAVSNVKVILSSWAFLDRLDNVSLDGAEDLLLMLEDVGREIRLSDKLKGLFLSKRSHLSILQHFKADKLQPDDKAVLLFTSGTESQPKGVPLTHRNVLSNIRGALECIKLYKKDTIFGFLPPFHSFGFTVTSLLGPLSGMRVAYSPNPTDGVQLALGLHLWKPNILVGAPTFLRAMLKAAKPEDLVQARLVVTGAEKAPQDLFKMVFELTGKECTLEGYGITECSPALTFNREGEPHVGVGKPLPGVEMIIVHPETMQEMPVGEQGMILVRGPTIFSGYINKDTASPFVEVGGKEWYKTGDLGFLDSAGNLTIGGRLKRFVKVGGEMVSLAAVEHALLHAAAEKRWPLNEEGPSMAVCAKEEAGDRTKLYLFYQHDLALDEVNKALRDAGFSNLVKISSIIKIGEIPILGTGKTNYRALEGQYLA